MKALLDSSVIIASIIEGHPEFQASDRLLANATAREFAAPSHGLAEAYAQLTRKSGPAFWGLAPAEAMIALDLTTRSVTIVGLTPAQTYAAIRSYAGAGGIGARLYDRLIGEVALIHSIPAIITLNTRHFRSLFPTLRVCTPAEYLA